MTKKNRNKARTAAMRESMADTFKRWQNAHLRGREPFKQLKEIFEATLAGPTTLLSREALIDQHRLDNRLSLNIAVAEVDQFHPKIVEDLRRNGMPLIHPVTEFGYKEADRIAPTDLTGAARCVPGVGSGGATYGWRIAHLTDDPAFVAYVQHRYNSGHRAIERSTRLANEAATAGLLTAPKVATLPDRLLP